jgi:hypothetical protein
MQKPAVSFYMDKYNGTHLSCPSCRNPPSSHRRAYASLDCLNSMPAKELTGLHDAQGSGTSAKRFYCREISFDRDWHCEAVSQPCAVFFLSLKLGDNITISVFTERRRSRSDLCYKRLKISLQLSD